MSQLHTVPTTGIYRSTDGKDVRYFTAGTVIDTRDAIRFGMAGAAIDVVSPLTPEQSTAIQSLVLTSVPSSARVHGPKTIVLGDSINAGNGVTDPNKQLYGLSVFAVATILSKSRIRWAGNAATTGHTTTQMLARLQTDVIAKAPDRCLVFGGINDYIQGGTNSVPILTTLAVVQANITAIVDRLMAANILPMLCAITPRGQASYLDYPSHLNIWLNDFARRRGIPFVDFFSLVTDPATQNYYSSYSSDGLHPNNVCVRVMAQYLVDRLMGDYLPWSPYQTAYAADPRNMIVNGTFTGDGNSDGVADSWGITTSSGSGTATPSLVTGDLTISGNWQRMVIASGQNVEKVIFQAITTGYTAGDTLAFSGRIRTTVEAGAMKPCVTIRQDPAAVTPYGPYAIVSDLDGLFYMEFPVEAARTSLVARIATGVPGGGASSGYGTLDVAQLTLLNLTTLGLV